MNFPRHLFRFALIAALLSPAAFAAVSAAAPDAAKTRQLMAVLQSDAALHERARACQQLAILGTADAVPALAALLADDKLGQYVRDALESMPDPAAGAALREALGRLEGKALVGVVSSLGARRDPQAVAALSRLAASSASPAASAALMALGRIGSPEAVGVLQQMLKSSAPELRNAAAEGSLLIAGVHLDQGRREAAAADYAAIRAAEVAAPVRIAATRGEILARGSAGIPLLLEQLHSADPALRAVSLQALRELPGADVLPAVLAQLDSLAPAVQALVVAALVDRRDPRVLSAVEARAEASDARVRIAALTALGRIGGVSSLSILLRAAGGGSDAESEAALASLGRINMADTNSAILRAIATAETPVRVKLIAVLGKRAAESATPDLIRLADGPDRESGAAALRALSIVARPSDLSELIRLSVTGPDEATKTLADRAIVTTAMKLPVAARADGVLAAFRQAGEAATKVALLRPLGGIVRSMNGSFDAFVAVRAALQDSSDVVREAALRSLADWPDATPATALLEVVMRDASATDRELAFRGATRMASNVALGRDHAPLDTLAFFTALNRVVRTKEEKLMMVSGLGSVRRIEAVRMLQTYLDDPAVRTEAALAVVQVAPALLTTRQGAEVKAVLEKIAATEKDEDTRRKAARFAMNPPAPTKQKTGPRAAVAPPVQRPTGPSLFNGQDLQGWEGDPGVWRVRDGVIVGGSLDGNPRNEFLATTRSFRNFTLQLEYKLVGTEGFVNGGVQFHSVRVDQPPNEMLGYQADIGAGHSGSLYDESRRKKFLARASAEQIKRLERPGEWNRYEIRCEGSQVTLLLNGEETLRYVETDSTITPGGLVALQIHGNCKAEISFRNLKIEERP